MESNNKLLQTIAEMRRIQKEADKNQSSLWSKKKKELEKEVDSLLALKGIVAHTETVEQTSLFS